MQILVSIIIPVHQIHIFFKSCVESALIQTYKNIEVIIACNGSLTIEECKGFLNIDDIRVIYLKTKDGRHNARNSALAIAKGAWIQYLDYDDYLFPEKIETQLKGIKENPISSIAICQWKKFTNRIEEQYTFPFENLYNQSKITAGQLVQKLGMNGGFIATASWLVPKEMLKDILWIDSPNDDAVFFSEVCKKKPFFIMVPEILAGYRIHDSNTSSIRSKAEFDKLMRSWRIIRDNLKNLENAQEDIYLYKSYLNLVVYSKQINKYRLGEVVCNCIYFGIKGKVGISLLKDLKNKLFK